MAGTGVAAVSLAAVVAVSLLRAFLVAVVALPICHGLARWIRASGGRERRRLVIALAALFLCPELLTGYAYAPRVVGLTVWAELTTLLVLMGRSLPLGTAMLLATPSSGLTASAHFVRGMVQRSWEDRLAAWHCWWIGTGRPLIPAFAVMMLVAFQEFELAALLKAISWTDWLFVAQVGGLSLSASWQAAWGPLAIQTLLLCGVLGLVGRRSSSEMTHELPAPLHRGERLGYGLALAAALLGVVGAPLLYLAAGIPAGFWQLLSQPSRWQGLLWEVLVGLSVSLTAATAAWVIASRERRVESREPENTGNAFTGPLAPVRGGEGRGEGVSAPQSFPPPDAKQPSIGPNAPLTLALSPEDGGEGTRVFSGSRLSTLDSRPFPTLDSRLILCLPGLSGTLLLSLLLLVVFQRTFFGWFNDTPLPWVLGLTLFLLPRAVFWRVWVESRDNSGVFLGRELAASSLPEQRRAGRQILWRQVEEPKFWGVAILTYWGYLDLTTAYLLAPTGLTSGIVRLYNFMHFGRTAALSAEAAVLLFTPLAMAGCVWWWLRR